MAESAAWPWDHLPKEAINRYFQAYKMPSSAGLSPEIKDNSDGSITVQYHPTKGGRHEVQMAYDGAAVDGSPFSCFVDQINGAFITAFGTGLVGGMSGQMESFTVTAKQGTLGQLNVHVDGPTKTDVKRQDHGDKCDIQYLPMTPGVYSISVKYAGKEMKGSPFIAKVSGEGRKRSQISLGNTSECSLNILETNVVDLVGTIKTPAGAIEPCLLKKDKDGHLCVASFTPREIGTYNVNIYRDEKAIKGSPFHINIGDKEIAHASKVKVHGATQKAMANQSNHLDIDCSEAGMTIYMKKEQDNVKKK